MWKELNIYLVYIGTGDYRKMVNPPEQNRQ